jgi:hypothetical protein
VSEQHDGPGTCFVCDPRGVSVAMIGAHVAQWHPELLAELERWPDGEPVVIDRTLEPGDFAPEPEGFVGRVRLAWRISRELSDRILGRQR